jgi:mono/diheme cytochrome c family protein
VRLSLPKSIAILAVSMSCVLCGEQTIVDTTTQSAMSFPGLSAGKADVFGRQLAGIAAPYLADVTLSAQEERLASDMGFRRQVAWDILLRSLDPVPLLGLADAANTNEEIELPNGQVPNVPRFQTWYGVDDFKRMFRRLFDGLGPEGRAARQPFSNEAIEEAEQWNAKSAERSERWPLERFLMYVKKLGVCSNNLSDADCAQSLQSNFSGATSGNTRITYSPGTMKHLLKNYGSILKCLEGLDQVDFATLPENGDQNFSYCFEQEFPVDAVLIKAHWVRSDFGRKMPAFDTDADALQKVIGPGTLGDWVDGDRWVDPAPDKVLTIRLKNTDTYRLGGLHIMTKELRHWVWITLWWSDNPDSDFGADRPAAVREKLDPVWSNYKMGVVVDYDERDPNPGLWFTDKPSLADALNVANDGLTWNSNPYIEHGRGNAKTNCIGCHQHGGSTFGPDLNGDGNADPFDLELVIDSPILFPNNGRIKQRELFPADYLWSTQRVDKLSQVIATEVANYDHQDKNLPEIRAIQVNQLTGQIEEGANTFGKNCAVCHGIGGKGTSQAPSLFERVPGFENDDALVTLLITGKSPMPSWAEFSNQELANVRDFLRDRFMTQLP